MTSFMTNVCPLAQVGLTVSLHEPVLLLDQTGPWFRSARRTCVIRGAAQHCYRSISIEFARLLASNPLKLWAGKLPSLNPTLAVDNLLRTP